MQELIPLNKLQLSDNNVRKTHNQEADEQLSHDIEARGLLQNLIVTKAKKRGHFDVIAGGRRLRAMTMIVERGAWEADRAVPCMLLVASDEQIAETSLAENFQRLAMTPAEECRAFQHFISQDEDTREVARRFGVTRRFVEGRLRLASLAEPIFEALASGEMSLEMAKAYASTDQHAVQLRVYEQAKYYGDNPDYVRRQIANGSVRGNDPLALLVGEDAYTAAGGRIERDLFTAASEDRWTDLETLQQLAAAKLEGEAARLLEETGLGTIWPVASTSSWQAARDLGLNRVSLPPAPLSEEATARIGEIEERIEAICIELDGIDEESDEAQALNEEYDRLDEEMQDLSNPTAELPDEWKAEVGRFLIVTTKGEMVLEADYFSEKHLRMERDEDGKVTGGSFEEPSGSNRAPAKPSAPEATGPGGKAYSARLFDELAVQRRNILSASLLSDPGLALDYAIFALADGLLHSYDNRGTTIRAPRPQDPVLDSTVPKGMADEIIAGAYDALDKAWGEHKGVVERFMAFRELDDEAKGAWIAYTVATSIEAKMGYASGYNPIHAQLGQLLEIEPAAMWRPTAQNYFDRINKGSILELLKDVGGAELSTRYAASKKTEISESCEKLFAGEVIVEDAIKERALAWVPAAMRFDTETPQTSEPGSTQSDDVDHDSEEEPDGFDPNVNDGLGDEYSEDTIDADENEIISA
ncbi:ParB/RepB/Spo0J family partition protein [Novosphingobium sp. HII-3]|uniref:ParB/RepB/Spo0J family partition protein n=1 Tax=Novosphingobium sp. HII-3 TaxID=2075565 RepID=UPI001E43971C|nr:ParB/RepB/Spo0J family partition protein [Novosphingobium sp. HII-3]